MSADILIHKGRLVPIVPIFVIDINNHISFQTGIDLTVETLTNILWAALKNQACCNPVTACRIVILNEQDITNAVQILSDSVSVVSIKTD